MWDMLQCWRAAGAWQQSEIAAVREPASKSVHGFGLPIDARDRRPGKVCNDFNADSAVIVDELLLNPNSMITVLIPSGRGALLEHSDFCKIGTRRVCLLQVD
jgi:hypothetical protein